MVGVGTMLETMTKLKRKWDFFVKCNLLTSVSFNLATRHTEALVSLSRRRLGAARNSTSITAKTWYSIIVLNESKIHQLIFTANPNQWPNQKVTFSSFFLSSRTLTRNTWDSPRYWQPTPQHFTLTNSDRVSVAGGKRWSEATGSISWQSSESSFVQ